MKKYRIRANSPLEHFMKFWIGGTLGLTIGVIVAMGMNEIYPLF